MRQESDVFVLLVYIIVLFVLVMQLSDTYSVSLVLSTFHMSHNFYSYK